MAVKLIGAKAGDRDGHDDVTTAGEGLHYVCSERGENGVRALPGRVIDDNNFGGLPGGGEELGDGPGVKAGKGGGVEFAAAFRAGAKGFADDCKGGGCGGALGGEGEAG